MSHIVNAMGTLVATFHKYAGEKETMTKGELAELLRTGKFSIFTWTSSFCGGRNDTEPYAKTVLNHSFTSIDVGSPQQ